DARLLQWAYIVRLCKSLVDRSWHDLVALGVCGERPHSAYMHMTCVYLEIRLPYRRPCCERTHPKSDRRLQSSGLEMDGPAWSMVHLLPIKIDQFPRPRRDAA